MQKKLTLKIPIRTVLLILALVSFQNLYAKECNVVARLVSIEGLVETRSNESDNWNSVSLHQEYCVGDSLRTGHQARAAVRLVNSTLLRLDSGSVITFTKIEEKEGSLLDLIKGAVHFMSRTPKSLDIRTPFVNAAIEGTEFVVQVSATAANVTVYEGLVVASNELGSIELTANQAARAEVELAPVRTVTVNPRDAVAWALYYPPLPKQTGTSDLLAAQAVSAIAKNDIDTAAALAQKAIATNSNSAAAFMAQSYVDQAQFNISDALSNSQKAASLAPNNALILARLAEVWLMFGNSEEAKTIAEKAVALSPKSSMAQWVLGFSFLRDIDLNWAKAAFETAIVLDSGAPLPHLGLGLVTIRQGDLLGGRESMETAALLDPSNSLLRSYMGKAYYEEKRDALAAEQFSMAKVLDPNDPTPWFYNSILLQTGNRPIQALEEINQAINRNHNRAVYRSSLLLDEDNASRNLSLARMYSDVGFEELAILKAGESLNSDPANYSAHRLIADSFAGRPRHEIARASEVLQSQLLQPLNINPAQPRLSETDLNILPGLVPLQTGYSEYHPLFDRNQNLLTLSVMGGSHDTISDEIVVSGIRNNFGYSLGQFHFETDGASKNKNAEYDIYNLFIQADISTRHSVQTELRYKEAQLGDLIQRFNEGEISPNKWQEDEETTFRLGYHFQPSQQSDFLASVIYTDEANQLTDKTVSTFPDGASLRNDSDIHPESESYQSEIQYIHKRSQSSVVAGLGYYETDVDITSIIRATFTPPAGPPLPQPAITDVGKESDDQSNVYLYLNYEPTPLLMVVSGVSYDDFSSETINTFDRDQFNYKLGLQWSLNKSTKLRSAVFRNMSKGSAVSQTLEPSTIAGFNQLFDDPEGSDATRLGVALDTRWTEHAHGGVELSRRDVESFVSRDFQNNTLQSIETTEYVHRAYVYWAASYNLSFGSEVRFEEIGKAHDLTFADVSNPNRVETLELPFFVHYYQGNGWFAKLVVTYVEQEIEFPNVQGGVDIDDDRFWLADASLGYRLPRRMGNISLDLKNLLDQGFSFQETDLFSRQRLPRYEPDQTVALSFTLNY